MFNDPCLEPLFPRRHVEELQTSLGNKTLYNSVSACNRCGICAAVCPTYQLYHQENFSPRGRNQILRLCLEGKIKLNKENRVLREALISCTLCGRCNEACAAQVPTAEHVLEMRRALGLRVLPRLLQSFLQLRDHKPRLFSTLTRTALILRRLWVVKIAWLFQITHLPGLTWINHLDDVLPARIIPLAKVLAKANVQANQENPELIYLPSLEAEFILPNIALATLRLAQKKYRTETWQNTATGLFSYVYGDLRQSRKMLRKLLARHAKTGNGKRPLLTDSVDVYLFLKRAPQLFSGRKLWQERAQNLAQNLLFVTDIFPTDSDDKIPSTPGSVQLERSALFERQGPAFEKAEKILTTLFGKNFVKCFYTDADTPAFGYTFVAPKNATRMSLKTVEKIARLQTQQVVTLSGLAALELAYVLKKFYPAAQATHFVHVNR
ncbi:MAG: (Fe-S)-binding protein [Elusimicrobiaceae bacterium]|nr:(Fe-S)-binding protein [Elusimicrobiaceae bacterium]